MKEKSSYHSPLRQEQMKKTREQILEGLIKTMAQGITEVSIPAVAREAGVSIPTVYRYFRTKRELVEALPIYLVEKAGLSRDLMQPAHNPEELVEKLRRMYIALQDQDETIRAATISELSFKIRKDALPARLQAFEAILAPARERFNEADWLRLRNVVLILSSTGTLRAFKDYLGLSGEEAADSVIWAILTLIRSSSQTREEQEGETDSLS